MASSAAKFTIETHGFKEAIKKLDPPATIMGEPLRHAWQDIAEFGESAAISLAPMERGGTIAAMQHKVSKSKVPLWAVVKTTAKRNGFPYPRVVNYSPFAFNGRKRGRRVLKPVKPSGVNHNRYWFDNAMNRARAYMGRMLDRAVAEMATRWEA